MGFHRASCTAAELQVTRVNHELRRVGYAEGAPRPRALRRRARGQPWYGGGNAHDALRANARGQKAASGVLREHDHAIGEEHPVKGGVVAGHAAHGLDRGHAPKPYHGPSDARASGVRCEEEVPEVGPLPGEQPQRHPRLFTQTRCETGASGAVDGLEAGAADPFRAARTPEGERVVANESEREVADQVLARVVPGRLDWLADEEHPGQDYAADGSAAGVSGI